MILIYTLFFAKITLIFDIAKLFSEKQNIKTRSQRTVPDSDARKSSAIGDERTDIDDGCTDTDDGCTDVGDGGTFLHEPCTNGGRTLKEWWSDFEGMTQKNCRYDTQSQCFYLVNSQEIANFAGRTILFYYKQTHKSMKKTLLMVAFAAVCSMAQAKILRVNNTTGSGAPYSTVADALTAAAEGDTIMLDGSKTGYGNITITKKLVVLGPGYWRSENGITAQGESDATLNTVRINGTAPGTILRGLTTGDINVNADNVVINRCHVTSDINVKTGIDGHADNCIIHQNFIVGIISGYANNNFANYTQVTNNIFAGNNTNVVRRLNEAYIAYNTFTIASVSYNFKQIVEISACRVEKNIRGIADEDIAGNTYIDNYIPSSPLFENHDTDLNVKNQEFTKEIAAAIEGKGAFNGDDPYVISGIPAGPVIQDVTVPASVEQGNNLNITIKLGVQK